MTESTDARQLVQRLNEGVLEPLKSMFVGKDEIIDLLGVCLVAGENLFLHGPPGTAKSALVQALARQLDGNMFDYLLTRFTEPNELFGPFDIRKLREGDLVTNTEGMLPEADFVFLDELLNANSAILNSLLMALNERVFRRGRETRNLPALMFVGASNSLPEDDALGALFDRFLLRVPCQNVDVEQLHDVLVAGWKLQRQDQNGEATLTVANVARLQQQILDVDLTALLPKFVDVVQRLRHAGIRVSDRRAVRLQRAIAASALIAGRTEGRLSDLWVMRYIWDSEEQQGILASIVQDVLVQDTDEATRHPRARGTDAPDPEQLARDLDRLEERLRQSAASEADQAFHKDQLGLLAARCQWVDDEQKRAFLEERVETLWKLAGQS
jgi:MoxR-like ATPase